MAIIDQIMAALGKGAKGTKGLVKIRMPNGKIQSFSDPAKLRAAIKAGGKPVSQAAMQMPRRMTPSERAAVSDVGGVAQTIARGKKPISQIAREATKTVPPARAAKKPGTAVAVRPSTALVPKPKPKPPAKKPGTALVPAGTRAVTTTKQQRAAAADNITAMLKNMQKKKPKGSVPSGGRRSTVKPPAGKPTRRITNLEKALAAAIAAGTIGAATQLGNRKPAKAGQDTPTKPVPPVSTPTPKPKAQKRKPSGPATRGSQKRGATKLITAGKNTGFGPKGNIFPSNAEERKALMTMYGGTGSAAAKAAIAGKQGNIAKGRSLYEAAKAKRLKKTTKKAYGGKITSMQKPTKRKTTMMPTKKSAMKAKSKGKMTDKKPMSRTEMPGAMMYKKGGLVARQVKGWGAARRPKK
jgi:hypothetical protein